MNWIVRIVVILSVLGGAEARAGGDVEAGAAKAAICSGCHGPDGISVNPLWPNLAGQHTDYLVKQIVAFRDGSRVEATMQPFVARLADTDAADIAAFYASRKTCR